MKTLIIVTMLVSSLNFEPVYTEPNNSNYITLDETHMLITYEEYERLMRIEAINEVLQNIIKNLEEKLEALHNLNDMLWQRIEVR